MFLSLEVLVFDSRKKYPSIQQRVTEHGERVLIYLLGQIEIKERFAFLVNFSY
jgi:hypothetical protein